MKKSAILLTSALFLFLGQAAANGPSDLKAGFVFGNPDIQSIHALAFGPEGILFIGDARRAEIFAVDVSDEVPRGESEDINMKQVDVQIAALLGTKPGALSIQDMAVNPLSRTVYLAVHLENGTPVLMKSSGEKWEHVALDAVSYAKTGLTKAVEADAKDNRGRPLRQWAISDMTFYEGKVMVSGLSNEEFSSIFRSIPFPFGKEQSYASLEIYHAAHGQYETNSPIKTFLPYKLNGKSHLLASYTCTPLVIFPLDEMKPGAHTKGKTVAELGNRNTPIDIVSYEKDGKSFLLLANSSRALMKIDPAEIENYRDYLTAPVEENSATAGISFIALPYVNVQQMDKLSDTQVLLLQRMANGDLDLHTQPNNRL